MDGQAAIEHNRQALKRILAAIIAMAGLCDGTGKTLQRRLYLAVLRLLRPAESAARRLIIAMARGLAVTLPPPRPSGSAQKIKLLPIIVRNGVGTGIVLPRGAPVPASLAHLVSPVATARPLVFPLTDAPQRWCGGRQQVVAAGVPRIGMPGVTARLAIPVRNPPAPDDPVDAARLGLRIEMLGRVLDDLPSQARRFARWQALRGRRPIARRFRRVWPLRPGRPPGGRLSRYDPDAKRLSNVRDIDEVLAHSHALAVDALEHPDTS